MLVLVTAVHDPDGRYAKIKWIKEALSKLQKLYPVVVIIVSSQTPEKTKKILKKYFKIIISEKHGFGSHIKEAFEEALKSGADYYHYCDLDRALHWIHFYEDELRSVLKNVSGEFVNLARTRQAFDSHPLTQTCTEKLLNDLVSEILGKPVDMGSGSHIFSRSVAEKFVSTKSQDIGYLGEWVRILKQERAKIKIIKVNGLEWETPDRYQNEIEKMGYKNWLKKFQNWKEWKTRLEAIKNIVKNLYTCL